MCNRHRPSRGFTIFIWRYDLEKWHKVTSHKDGVNAPIDIGGHIACEGTELWTFIKRLKVTCTRLVNLTMGASLLSTVLESERCIGRPRKPLLWCKHLVSVCYRSAVIADSNFDGRLLLADGVQKAAEAAVAARSRSRAWPSDVVFKPKPREVSACDIERAQHCYGRPNYAMTTSYQWTAVAAAASEHESSTSTILSI